ncbi:group I truncated hemoglobin [Vibrio sp. SCSIO 43137]|uniref:group I truncated hemoglobin n=1 Tax=Vibrio sp. SCSIO 43137 TaxID=3021011 RepID=UPI0023070A5E|nr:group 1 truncated hemoglobin [Vibrio sp. SCSIO 43137]WCE31605.1 group 1 truncated hemoglobin [Vibrio sp. SCSIO 43137]
MSTSLYERLGGSEKITQISSDIVDLHLDNQTISNRFANSDTSKLKKTVSEFFITGTGGPNLYKGKDMRAVHQGMNISAIEFVAVLDDALEAMQKNSVGQREQEEVLFILYSMRNDVILV